MDILETEFQNQNARTVILELAGRADQNWNTGIQILESEVHWTRFRNPTSGIRVRGPDPRQSAARKYSVVQKWHKLDNYAILVDEMNATSASEIGALASTRLTDWRVSIMDAVNKWINKRARVLQSAGMATAKAFAQAVNEYPEVGAANAKSEKLAAKWNKLGIGAKIIKEFTLPVATRYFPTIAADGTFRALVEDVEATVDDRAQAVDFAAIGITHIRARGVSAEWITFHAKCGTQVVQQWAGSKESAKKEIAGESSFRHLHEKTAAKWECKIGGKVKSGSTVAPLISAAASARASSVDAAS